MDALPDDVAEIPHLQKTILQRAIVNKGGSMKSTGAYWSKSHKKWRSQISIDGEKVHLGMFLTQKGAHLAYMGALKAKPVRDFDTRCNSRHRLDGERNPKERSKQKLRFTRKETNQLTAKYTKSSLDKMFGKSPNEKDYSRWR